jgi:hypothetical protein
MLTYQMDLLSADGSRSCLLAIMCRHDLAAIVLAKSILRMKIVHTSRVVVWRGDELIFEYSSERVLN